MAPKGFQGTTLLDYPGKIASLIFYGGCNLACPYCHNPGLVTHPDQYPDLDLDHLLEDLHGRRSFIDGVVISGGEPTLAADLDQLLASVKGLGLAVKLDTNGLRPQRLREMIDHGMVDFVALDLKTRPDRYDELHYLPVNCQDLQATIDLLREERVDYEIRSTCVPGYVELEDIHAMGEAIKGARTWVLQQFVPGFSLSSRMREVAPHSDKMMQTLAAAAEMYVKDLELRGF